MSAGDDGGAMSDRRGRGDEGADEQARATRPWRIDWWVRQGLRQVWRLIVLIVGGTVFLLGLIMVVTPGPALIVVPIGLAILAVEFGWARRLLQRVRAQASRLRDHARSPRDRD